VCKTGVGVVHLDGEGFCVYVYLEVCRVLCVVCDVCVRACVRVCVCACVRACVSCVERKGGRYLEGRSR